MSTTKETDYVLSFIRLLSMVMIIMCHFFQGVNNPLAFIFNVGVQIFLFISGFIYSHKEIKNIKEWYKKKLFRIFIPYWILVIGITILNILILKQDFIIDNFVVSMLGLQAFSVGISNINHTWFISYILICYLITPLLNKINVNSSKDKDIVFAVKLLSLILFMHILQYYNVINIMIPYVSCYVIAYYIGKRFKDVESFKIKNLGKILLCFVIMLGITLPLKLCIEFKSLNELPGIVLRNKDLIFAWWHTLFGITIFTTIYYLCRNIKKIRFKKVLDFSDKYSYYIYLVHQVFILGSFSLLYITKHFLVNCVIILIIFSSFILYNISNYIFKYIKKGEKYLIEQKQ